MFIFPKAIWYASCCGISLVVYQGTNAKLHWCPRSYLSTDINHTCISFICLQNVKPQNYHLMKIPSHNKLVLDVTKTFTNVPQTIQKVVPFVLVSTIELFDIIHSKNVISFSLFWIHWRGIGAKALSYRNQSNVHAPPGLWNISHITLKCLWQQRDFVPIFLNLGSPGKRYMTTSFCNLIRQLNAAHCSIFQSYAINT